MPYANSPPAPPAGSDTAKGAGRRLRLSLRLRVLLLITTTNVLVFGGGLVYLSRAIARDRARVQERYAAQLDRLLRPTVRQDGRLKVAQILAWPHWSELEDAIILGRNWDVSDDGRIRPRGVFLNPCGRYRRRADFDLDAVLRQAVRAFQTRRLVAAGGERAVPIIDDAGEPWGALWYRVELGVDRRALVLSLLPWFLASTVLLSGGTFLVLRRFVLEPVELLADAARRVRLGELTARVPEPDRQDELADLLRGFNLMAAQVEDFHERLRREVDEATRKARAAEAVAMRQRQLAAMGELAAGIAHEINNPLGGMLNAVDVLKRDDLNEPRRARYVELLRDGLERIRETVGKLLRLTPREPARVPVDLAPLVRDAVELGRHRVRDGRVEVEALLPERAPRVLGDPTELGQAVLNLVANACDALEGRPRGRVEVELFERAGPDGKREIAIVVRDDGPGVPPADLERIGDPYFTTKEVGKGTGLGLALVHSIALRHGGRLELGNLEGGGFRAELVIPVEAAEEGP